MSDWKKALDRFQDVYAAHPRGTLLAFVQTDLDLDALDEDFRSWWKGVSPKASPVLAGNFRMLDGRAVCLYAMGEYQLSKRGAIEYKPKAWLDALVVASRYAALQMDQGMLAAAGVCEHTSQEPSHCDWLGYLWANAGGPNRIERPAMASIKAIQGLLAKAVEPTGGKNIISAKVVEQRYYVTRKTIREHIKVGDLIDYRPKGHRPNAENMVDEHEIMKIWTRRPEK